MEHATGIDGNYGRDHGIAFIGNNGTLALTEGWKCFQKMNVQIGIKI